jgi:hypothetical protein
MRTHLHARAPTLPRVWVARGLRSTCCWHLKIPTFSSGGDGLKGYFGTSSPGDHACASSRLWAETSKAGDPAAAAASRLPPLPLPANREVSRLLGNELGESESLRLLPRPSSHFRQFPRQINGKGPGTPSFPPEGEVQSQRRLSG